MLNVIITCFLQRSDCYTFSNWSVYGIEDHTDERPTR